MDTETEIISLALNFLIANWDEDMQDEYPEFSEKQIKRLATRYANLIEESRM
jgi:hypothetical protein